MRQRLQNAQAENNVPLGWRAARSERGGRRHGPVFIHSARARPARAPPLGSALLCVTQAGEEGVVRRGGPQTEPLWETWGGNGANAPLRRKFSYRKHSYPGANGKWNLRGRGTLPCLMGEEKRQGLYAAVPLCCDMAPPFRPLVWLSSREVASPSGGSENREGFVLWLLCVGLSGRPAFGCPGDREPVAFSHVKVAILAGPRTVLRTTFFIPALRTAGGWESGGGRLVASNFLVKASVMKMAEKQNNESSVIALTDCRPPTPSAEVLKESFPFVDTSAAAFPPFRKEASHKADLMLTDFSYIFAGKTIDVRVSRDLNIWG